MYHPSQMSVDERLHCTTVVMYRLRDTADANGVGCIRNRDWRLAGDHHVMATSSAQWCGLSPHPVQLAPVPHRLSELRPAALARAPPQPRSAPCRSPRLTACRSSRALGLAHALYACCRAWAARPTVLPRGDLLPCRLPPPPAAAVCPVLRSAQRRRGFARQRRGRRPRRVLQLRA